MSQPDPADFATNKRLPAGAGETGTPHSTTPHLPVTGPGGSPARIGKFAVRGLLGEGAFARVYLGFDPELEREVAIKVPKVDEITPEFRESFVRENRLAAIIHHPNICPVYEVGSDGNMPYIVMRVVPGTLAGLLRRLGGPMPPRTAVAITRKLALGLAAAHALKVVHRDLKPANVLYDAANREVLIADFGLARFADQATAASNGVPKGTPAYMAPEQARGLANEVGPLSDVYALGVILYELLTGGVPFKGSVWEVMRDHCETAPRPPSRLAPGIDPDLDALCLKAMAKVPAQRFPSAKALAAALADYLRTHEQSGTFPQGGAKKKPAEALPVADEIPDLPDEADPGATEPDPRDSKRSRARATPVPAPARPIAQSRKSPPKAAPAERTRRNPYLIPVVAVVMTVLLLIAGVLALLAIGTAVLDDSDGEGRRGSEKATGPVETAGGKTQVGPLDDFINGKNTGPVPNAKQPEVKPIEPVKWPYPPAKNIEPVPNIPPIKKADPPKVEPKKPDPVDAELQRDWADYKKAILTTGTLGFVKARGPTRWRAWKQAAEAGSASGMVLYARCLLEGIGTTKNLVGANALYRKAADLGEPVAMNNLGYSYNEGEGVAADKAEAVRWYKKAADLGDPTATNNLGWCYKAGEGVPRDAAEAVRLYRKAADLGSALAMNNLGACYDEGTGVPKDPGEAVKWYTKSAELGDRRGMSNLGYSYLNGEGVTKNAATAVAWFQKAADAGHANAMNQLGVCHHTAAGVPRNDVVALQWFRKAADGGEPLGMNNVGVLHEYGEGVATDKVEAVKWYRKSADAGSKDGMLNLARCLENAIGVTKDAKEAAAWRTKAANAK